jgi:hypothetical protein
MDQIYQNSTVTIAASRANTVEEGFLKPILSLLPPPGHMEPLDTRGWAFQEDLLSQRVIQFPTYGEVAYFSCSNSIGNVNRPKTRGLVQSITNILARDHRIYSSYRDLVSHDEWSTILSIFTSKSLSYPEDRIPALSGIANAFSTYLTSLGENPERPDAVCGNRWSHYAGIWLAGETSHCLQWSSLMWKVSSLSGAFLPRPASYLGPSWSWGSVSSPVTTFRAGSLQGDSRGGKNFQGQGVKRYGQLSILSIGPHRIDSKIDGEEVKDGFLVMRGTLMKATWTLEWSDVRDAEFLNSHNWIATGRTQNIIVDSHIPASRFQHVHPLRWEPGSVLSFFGLPDAAIPDTLGCGEPRTMDVFLLPVAAASRSWWFEGFILEKTVQGTYRRLGVFGDCTLQVIRDSERRIVPLPGEIKLQHWFPQETVRIE